MEVKKMELTDQQFLFELFFNKELGISILQGYNAKRIFLVNAAKKMYITPYFPVKRKKEIPSVAFGGIITGNEKISRGIICVIPYNIKEMRKDKELRNEIKSQVIWIAKRLNIHYIALSGVLPQTMKKDGALSSEFVTGEKGTIFAISECFYFLKFFHEIKSPKIAVLGGNGRIGNPLIAYLKLAGENIFSIDIADSREKISSANFIINLAPYGDILLEYTDYLQKGIFVLDDSYPKQNQPVPDSTHYRVSLEALGVRYEPSIPTFNPWGILGCDAEAICRSSSKIKTFCTQERFNIELRRLGVKAAPILWKKDG